MFLYKYKESLYSKSIYSIWFSLSIVKEIVKSCSFEFVEPAGIEQVEKGYLVTSDTMVVREVFKGSSTVSFVFPKKVPMYIL